MTLSTHLRTVPAGVTGVSFHPFALRFALNYGKEADARCIWMHLNRTGTLFFFISYFPSSVTSKLTQHISASPFIMQVRKQPTKIAQGY